MDLSGEQTGTRQHILKWTRHETERSAYIDFAQLFSPSDQGVAYAYRTFTVAKETDMVVGIGSNDGVKLWVNGKLLLNQKASRVAAPDQEIVTLPLKPGKNTVLLKSGYARPRESGLS